MGGRATSSIDTTTTTLPSVSLLKRQWAGFVGMVQRFIQHPHQTLYHLLRGLAWVWVFVTAGWVCITAKDAFFSTPETARLQALQMLPAPEPLSSQASEALLPMSVRQAIETQTEALPLNSGFNTEASLQNQAIETRTHRKPSVAKPRRGKKHASPKAHYQTKPLPALHSIPLNSASSEMLQRLPGVGEKMAQAILNYRKTHGKFESIEALNNVKGVGDKKLAKWRPYLKL